MASNALTIQWIYGFSKEIIGGVQSLTKTGRNALFCVSAHSGIIYDYEYRTQTVLQGHCNFISCCALSKDKRWIVTGDAGNDSILVVWDSLTGAPVKTLFSPHINGVISVDISDDALFIATLSDYSRDSPQEIAIWAWTRDSDSCLLREQVLSNEKQHEVKFNTYLQSELSTTGAKSVSFWNWEEFRLEGYMGKASKTDFGHYSGKFTSTIFFGANGSSAVTSTEDGYVIAWGTQYSNILLENPGEKNMKMASKVIRLMDCSITAMTVINDYLAVACSDGAVRFFDFSLRLEAWFEDLAAGPLSSLSFSVQKCPFPAAEAGAPGLKFWVPDFLVGTTEAFIVGMESSAFDEISPDDRRGTLLVQGMAEEISCVCCHPNKTLLALTCYNGTLQIWDYDMKLLMNLREFNTREAPHLKVGLTAKLKAAEQKFLRPQCCSFDPTGEFIAVGFTSGDIKFFAVDTYDEIASFAPSADTILHLKFSPSGTYLASYDSSNHVIILNSNHPKNNTENEENSLVSDAKDSYSYLGRIISHSASISGLEFGARENGEVLLSVGQDRRAVEYNLSQSTAKSGILIVDNPVRIELTAVPTCIAWNPIIGDDMEDRFIVGNNEFKFKEINADSKLCRKTTLAPAFGNPPISVSSIPIGETINHYFYSTAERIIGVGCLPLTGNPTEVMGLVAHPGRISSTCISFDGKYAFSAGGKDLTTAMWAIDTLALQKPEKSEEDITPFLELLQGGVNGDLHNDIIDYFYMCQLRTQGENSMDVRAVTGRIPLVEIPSLFRAIGFYPTEEDVESICNEVRFKHYVLTGNTQENIGLNDIIKLYVNHRPSNPLNSRDIENAFNIIQQKLGVDDITQLKWSDLQSLLLSEGEVFTTNDLTMCLTSLLGKAEEIDPNERIDANIFSSLILGFEDTGGSSNQAL